MKKHLLPLLALFVFAQVLAAGEPAPEFYVFDNGVGRGKWTPDQQATALKELGYAGISYNFTNPEDLAAWQQAFGKVGLKIFGLYFYTTIENPAKPYDPRLPEAIRLLKGTDTVLWMTIVKASGQDRDDDAVKLVRQLADLAAESGVRIALYGHAGFYIANATDSARIAAKAQRPNVGATINLCHEFSSGQQDKLDATVQAVAPHAIRASINGVDPETKKFVLPLNQGSFDVLAFVKKLRAAGYKGPIGLQCYNAPGDIRENLEANIASWRKIAERL